MFDTVLFDLDGTLTDPFEGITKSVAYALNKFGIEVADRAELKSFIGPPLYRSFMVKYGFTESDALKAVDFYREYYSVKGLYENTVYEGIKETLAALQAKNKRLAVATSKPEGFSKEILNHFGLSRYFKHIAGATLDSSRVEKADVIAYALKMLKDADPARTVMVGDRKHDVLGAAAHGIKTVGVLYGYGDSEELLKAGAFALAKEPEDILKIIN